MKLEWGSEAQQALSDHVPSSPKCAEYGASSRGVVWPWLGEGHVCPRAAWPQQWQPKAPDKALSGKLMYSTATVLTDTYFAIPEPELEGSSSELRKAPLESLAEAIDYVPASLPITAGPGTLYVYEDNEAVLKMF